MNSDFTSVDIRVKILITGGKKNQVSCTSDRLALGEDLFLS